jgi:hypothetical protein
MRAPKTYQSLQGPATDYIRATPTHGSAEVNLEMDLVTSEVDAIIGYMGSGVGHLFINSAHDIAMHYDDTLPPDEKLGRTKYDPALQTVLSSIPPTFTEFIKRSDLIELVCRKFTSTFKTRINGSPFATEFIHARTVVISMIESRHGMSLSKFIQTELVAKQRQILLPFVLKLLFPLRFGAVSCQNTCKVDIHKNTAVTDHCMKNMTRLISVVFGNTDDADLQHKQMCLLDASLGVAFDRDCQLLSTITRCA